MENDLLSKVIEAERQIQQSLESERNKAVRWLECVSKEAEEELVRESAEANKRVEEILEKAVADARERASALIKAANEKAEKIDRLDDAVLKKNIINHVHWILPAR